MFWSKNVRSPIDSRQMTKISGKNIYILTVAHTHNQATMRIEQSAKKEKQKPRVFLGNPWRRICSSHWVIPKEGPGNFCLQYCRNLRFFWWNWRLPRGCYYLCSVRFSKSLLDYFSHYITNVSHQFWWFFSWFNLNDQIQVQPMTSDQG